MENQDKIENKDDKIYQMRQGQISQLVQQINKNIRLRISELKTFIIFTMVIIGIVSYLFYESIKYIRDEIKSTNTQIEIVLAQNTYMQKNMKALGGTICYNCHNTTVMFLPKTTLSLAEFTKYVRGDRFVTNSVMPIFTDKDISDIKLQEIWKNLY